MVQMVINDNEEQRFLRIFERLVNQTKIDIEQYYLTAYKSPELGRILYEEQLMPIYKTLEKSLFIKAFSEILEGEKILGSVRGYLKILYAIFGRDAQITFTNQPLHLKIDIVAPVQRKYFWKAKRGQHIITKDGKAIVFKQLLAEVTDRELLQILKATTKAGTFVEFTLNREGEI
jgi:hypothetical protein